MRALHLLAPLCALTLTMAACGSDPETTAPEPTPDQQETASASPTPSATPTPTPAPCAIDPQSISLEEQVGLLFMMGKDTTTPVDETYQQILDENHIRSVVLLGNTDVGVEGVRSMVEEIDPDDSRLIAADQEGGQVQRLQGPGFDTMPSAAEQAELSEEELTTRATGWAEQLGEAGVEMNLAPVADVVPEDVGDSNEPVAALERGYGSDPAVVGAHASAYVTGMQAGGQLTSVKHFPGLGAVAGNTDFSADVVDDRTTRDDPGLEPFRTVVENGADSVMVATAEYDQIDPGRLAAFSPVVINEMLRGDLGFDGVVISDDMGGAAQVANVAPGDRAVQFLEAGGDIVINGDPSIQGEMTGAVVAKAQQDEVFADEVAKKVSRISALYERNCAS